MKNLVPLLIVLLCARAGAVGAQAIPGPAATSPNGPILSGHSHNDYEHEEPLWEALSYSFISIEVDIYLVDGALLVGHDEEDLMANRTLQSLYLDPLRDHVRTHEGRVYPSPRPLDLLVDIKSEAIPTYRALSSVLAQYSEMLTSYTEIRVEEGAISVIVSGNRPRGLMMDENVRYATYDGRIADLETEVPENFISLISDNWEDHFVWRGVGRMAEAEQRRLTELVRTAHRSGYRLRFWNTPSPENPPVEEVWSRLLAAGVDLIGPDDLRAYRDFVSGSGPAR